MALKQDLMAINKMYAGQATLLPYTLGDVRNILLSSVKFEKKYTFKGILPPDTVNRLRSEGLDVELNPDNNHTVLSWGTK